MGGHARVVDVTAAELPSVLAYLEERIDTSLFLLNNLRAFGPRRGASPYSGDFRALVTDAGIAAVWCAARNGYLVLQADGDIGCASVIDADIGRQGAAVRGVLGDWAVGAALWERVQARFHLVTTQRSCEILYRLPLSPETPAVPPPDVDVRVLAPADEHAWDELAAGYLEEQRLPLDSSAARRAGFVTQARNGHWWGAWDGGRLVSIASFNSYYHPVAQVGGVFTRPDDRRKGLSRAVMQTLLRDAVLTHRLTRIILFTGERQQPARALYESLGFEKIGVFGLFFGERASPAGAIAGPDGQGTPGASS
ncbi:MAG: GNAT family N-acetyltransferase [Vicinamibacterales bacterium]